MTKRDALLTVQNEWNAREKAHDSNSIGRKRLVALTSPRIGHANCSRQEKLAYRARMFRE